MTLKISAHQEGMLDPQGQHPGAEPGLPSPSPDAPGRKEMNKKCIPMMGVM
jgi:hypothetical protein